MNKDRLRLHENIMFVNKCQLRFGQLLLVSKKPQYLKLTAHSTTISFFSFISTNLFYLHKIYQLNKSAPQPPGFQLTLAWQNVTTFTEKELLIVSQAVFSFFKTKCFSCLHCENIYHVFKKGFVQNSKKIYISYPLQFMMINLLATILSYSSTFFQCNGPSGTTHKSLGVLFCTLAEPALHNYCMDTHV